MAEVEEVDVLLTDEIRRKLKRHQPIKMVNEFTYVPKVYREVFPERKDLWPIFKLKAAGGLDKVLAQDALLPGVLGDDTVRLNRGACTLMVCKGRVLSWKKYWDIETKEEYQFDASLQCLGPDLLHELANAILDPKSNGLSAEEKLGLE